MANTLVCDIVTPDQMLFRGEAVHVSAPAAEGDIGMMYQCSPLMSTLRRGMVQVKGTDDKVQSFAVNDGYLEVDGKKVVVLATRAVDLAEVQKETCKEAIADYEARLAALDAEDPKRAFAEAEISWQNYLLGLL